jgi:hypothetical protein
VKKFNKELVMVYKSALDAIKSGVPGAKTIHGVLSEAILLVGVETVDVEGRRAWFGLPINEAPGTDFNHPNGVWHVPVGHGGKELELQGLEMFYRNPPEMLPK